jgi:hypothetical protein
MFRPPDFPICVFPPINQDLAPVGMPLSLSHWGLWGRETGAAGQWRQGGPGAGGNYDPDWPVGSRHWGLEKNILKTGALAC